MMKKQVFELAAANDSYILAAGELPAEIQVTDLKLSDEELDGVKGVAPSAPMAAMAAVVAQGETGSSITMKRWKLINNPA